MAVGCGGCISKCCGFCVLPAPAVFESNCLKLASVMQEYPSVAIRPHVKVGVSLIHAAVIAITAVSPQTVANSNNSAACRHSDR